MSDRGLRLFSVLIFVLFFAVLAFAVLQGRAYMAVRDAEDMDQVCRAHVDVMHKVQLARVREGIDLVKEGWKVDPGFGRGK